MTISKTLAFSRLLSSGERKSPLILRILCCRPPDFSALPIEVFGHPVDNSGKVNADATQTLVSARQEEATALQEIAAATVRNLNAHSGYLNAPQAIRQERDEPSRPLREGERFESRWTGKLTYFPSPANVELVRSSNKRGKVRRNCRHRHPRESATV